MDTTISHTAFNNTINTYKDMDKTAKPIYDIYSIKYFIFISFTIFGGTLGNILSFILYLFRPALRNQPVAIYVCCLAIMDTGVLWVIGSTYWTKRILHFIMPGAGTMCNLNWFLSPVFSAASAWASVLMTLDRIWAVFFPFHYKVK